MVQGLYILEYFKFLLSGLTKFRKESVEPHSLIQFLRNMFCYIVKKCHMIFTLQKLHFWRLRIILLDKIWQKSVFLIFKATPLKSNSPKYKPRHDNYLKILEKIIFKKFSQNLTLFICSPRNSWAWVLNKIISPVNSLTGRKLIWNEILAISNAH